MGLKSFVGLFLIFGIVAVIALIYYCVIAPPLDLKTYQMGSLVATTNKGQSWMEFGSEIHFAESISSAKLKEGGQREIAFNQ